MNLNPGKTEFTDQEHDDIRRRVDLAKAAEGLKEAEIARQADMSPSTLNSYLKAKYGGDNDVPAGALHRWLAGRDRAQEMRRQLPVHPAYQPLYTSQQFMNLFDYARELGRIIVVAGVPGISKTASARQYVLDNNRAWLATMEASTGAVPMMLQEILGAMGEPEATGTNLKMMRRIAARIGDTKSVLLLDECQHLSDQSIEMVRAINDRCRQLYPTVGVGICMLGNEELYTKVGTTGGKRAFAQVSSRIAQRRYLIKPDPRDVTMLGQAWADANGEELTKDMANFLQAIASKHGGLRNVEMTFEGALLAARGAGQPLQIEHLVGAFAQASGEKRAA